MPASMAPCAAFPTSLAASSACLPAQRAGARMMARPLPAGLSLAGVPPHCQSRRGGRGPRALRLSAPGAAPLPRAPGSSGPRAPGLGPAKQGLRGGTPRAQSGSSGDAPEPPAPGRAVSRAFQDQDVALELERAEAQARAKAQAEAEAKAKAEAQARAEAEARAQALALALAQEKANAQAQAEAKAKAEAEAEAQAKAEAEAEAQAKAEAEADAQAKAEAQAEAKAKAEAEAQALAQAEAEAEAEAESAEAQAEAEAASPSSSSSSSSSADESGEWSSVSSEAEDTQGQPEAPPQEQEPPLEAQAQAWTPASALGGEWALLGYICGGVLLPRAGLSRAAVQAALPQWAQLGTQLAQQLGFDPAREGGLSYPELGRIFHYYLPVFFWCLRQLDLHRQHHPGRPMVVGISAPQGCGKTTVVESLEYLLGTVGVSAASVSLDDFYLTYQEQSDLAARNPGNKLLELRGNAGTHDLGLAMSTMASLLAASTPESKVPLPRYDKSAYSGRGDRASAESWPVAQGPLDVVLLEGWMLGFTPVPEEEARSLDPQLVAVNRNLAEFKSLHDCVDAWIVIQVDDPEWVFQWRLEAEVRMRSKGKAGMTDEQVADFVSRYIPAYRAYLKGFYAAGPPGADPEKTLRLSVDRRRNPK